MCGGTVSREDDAWWSEKAHICFSLFFSRGKDFSAAATENSIAIAFGISHPLTVCSYIRDRSRRVSCVFNHTFGSCSSISLGIQYRGHERFAVPRCAFKHSSIARTFC